MTKIIRRVNSGPSHSFCGPVVEGWARSDYIRFVNDLDIPALPAYRFFVEPARNGEPVAVIESAGQKHYIGSRYDPGREIERFASSLEARPGDLVVLLGGGLRCAAAVLQNQSSFLLAYLEPFPELRTGDPAADPRLKVLADPPSLSDWLERVPLEDLIRFRFVIHPSVKPLLADYAAAVSKMARSIFESKISAAMTLAAIGRLVVKNILSNLETFSRMTPVRQLFMKFPGSAACVVGSGPSLDRSAGDIAEFQDRMWVIAADSAVAPLIDRGVVPDFAVCLDPRKEEEEHVADLPERARSAVKWVLSSGVHPVVLRHLAVPRKFIFTGDHPLELWLAERFGESGGLAGGGSVILPAFDLACRLGVSDIVLAGADFSYGPGRLSHSLRSAKIQKRLLPPHRFITFETDNFYDADEKAPRRVQVDGVVYRTGENLIAYRNQLESLVLRFGGRCRHLRPGLKIAGAQECKSLSELSNLPILNKEDSVFESPALRQGWARREDLAGVQDDLRRRLAAGIETDPIFRTAVESVVFQRIRQTGEKAPAILKQVSLEVAEEMERVLDRSRGYE